MNSKLKKVTIATSIIFLLGGVWFSHSTPERAVRTYIMFHENFIKGTVTEIQKCGIDQTYGQLYCAQNPQIYSKWSYSVSRWIFGLWIINESGVGRG